LLGDACVCVPQAKFLGGTRPPVLPIISADGFVNLLVLTQISTSVQRTMADVALTPRALTYRAVVPVSVYLDTMATESPASVSHHNHSWCGYDGVSKNNFIYLPINHVCFIHWTIIHISKMNKSIDENKAKLEIWDRAQREAAWLFSVDESLPISLPNVVVDHTLFRFLISQSVPEIFLIKVEPWSAAGARKYRGEKKKRKEKKTKKRKEKGMEKAKIIEKETSRVKHKTARNYLTGRPE